MTYVPEAGELIRRYEIHDALVKALRDAEQRLSAIAGLLQTYPRPSNDPNGRTLLDAKELAAASAQSARAVLAALDKTEA